MEYSRLGFYCSISAMKEQLCTESWRSSSRVVHGGPAVVIPMLGLKRSLFMIIEWMYHGEMTTSSLHTRSMS